MLAAGRRLEAAVGGGARFAAIFMAGEQRFHNSSRLPVSEGDPAVLCHGPLLLQVRIIHII